VRRATHCVEVSAKVAALAALVGCGLWQCGACGGAAGTCNDQLTDDARSSVPRPIVLRAVVTLLAPLLVLLVERRG
jgi:hypothetical protein